jgi:antitoxin ParD1/3/4
MSADNPNHHDTESWLRDQVAPAFDRLKADPGRAFTISEVRQMLAAEHEQALEHKKHSF